MSGLTTATASRASTDVLVDLGRSHVHLRAGDVDISRPGGAGLSDPGGPDAMARIVADAVRSAGIDPPDGWRLALAAPGVVTAPDLAQRAAAELGAAFDRPPREVLVVSDSAAWQVGAFAGGDGAVVALGTGAVVVVRDGDRVQRIDGLGLLLGDVGGAAWTGRAALQRAAVMTGKLHDAAVSRFGPRTDWPGLLAVPDLAARLGAFAPDVSALAADGDPDGVAVLDDAARGVLTTLAAVPTRLPICVVGGFGPVLLSRLQRATDRTWVAPHGDALDGLAILLDQPGPFDRETVRVRRDAAAGQPAAAGGSTPHGANDSEAVDRLPTEAVASDTVGLDTWPTERLVARLVAGQDSAQQAAVAAIPALAHASDLVAQAFRGSGRLVYVGAGTPGRLAVQDTAELVPTFGLAPERAVVLLAGGAAAGAQAIENAEDDRTAGARGIDDLEVGPDDVVVGISASGRTPFVLAALHRARERGGHIVGVCNVPGSELSKAADVAVELATGAEVIAGSTRLAAGTAQKIALNTISTAALVRAGSTYGPWMVDMMATNAKLRRRAVRMVRDAAGVAEPAAVDALDAADGSVAVALVIALTGSDPVTARDRLAAAGTVRAAVAS